ncbi:DUF4232 domain-containing protein [Amycolatopsis sp. 195334CR]|uniref:DUF4232 domain-containing protein n=1 Tax=Amycolatopsis sp. 195334CR TaxID=2814588 RepID=UPI001A8E0EEA|nr:DUF4232 domain-containing protein [Amycolatopsis sp. 195334CR]MBN6037672.1 DUF4232 domain-containing protein [Amycolatopsis sp. 195334CR]
MTQQPTRTRAFRRIAMTAAALGATGALAACGTSGQPAPQSQAQAPAAAQDPAPAQAQGPAPAPSTPDESTMDTKPVSMATAHTEGLCKAASLDLSLVPDEGGAGMNQNHFTLRFTNKSGEACSLKGSPGVSFVAGDDGHQLGDPAERVPADQGALVRIAPGGHADSPLTVVNAGVYDETECQPALSRGLRVYAPGDTAAMFVPFEHDACTVAGKHQLSVDVVR